MYVRHCDTNMKKCLSIMLLDCDDDDDGGCSDADGYDDDNDDRDSFISRCRLNVLYCILGF